MSITIYILYDPFFLFLSLDAGNFLNQIPKLKFNEISLWGSKPLGHPKVGKSQYDGEKASIKMLNL